MSSQGRRYAGLDNVMNEVLQAHRSLLSSSDLTTAVNSAFGKVGTAAEVDRVYVFETHVDSSGVTWASQRFEWVAAGVEPQIDNQELQNIALREAGYSRWLDSFLAFRPVYGSIDQFPEAEQPKLRQQGIRSLLILPLFVGGALKGFVGFDDCKRERNWCNAELDLLFALTITLGQVLSPGGRSDADAAAIAAISLVSSMLTVHSATLSETPMQALVERTRARLGAAVHAHRVFAEKCSSTRVNAQELFGGLQHHFSEIRTCIFEDDAQRSINIDVAPVEIGVEAALSVVMIITEVLTVLAERCEQALEAPDLTMTLLPHEQRGELTITARDSAGVPYPAQEPLDGMAHLMIRHLLNKLNATQSSSRIDGILFRLSFPL